MRVLSAFLLILGVFGSLASGQSDVAGWKSSLLAEPTLSKVEAKTELRKFDLSGVWTAAENTTIFGFIGKNYRRIRIKIISAEKTADPFVYNVTGASLVGDTFRRFKGTIAITNARMFKVVEPEFAKEAKVKKRGIVLANYNFIEEGTGSHSGTFSGTAFSAVYIDTAGKLHYDELEGFADGFSNNQFAGEWRSKDGKVTLVCNWGDSRIPLSGDLDIGDGEFSPNPKYFKNGWQSYHDAYVNQNAAALKEEQREWWKERKN
ncbi:MAG: hypothetical protein KF756_03770 [Acidobacteria bacterium]|nr:hypothetical protein [Acidobacteriota bacterium]